PKIGAISEEEVHRFRTGLASGRTRRIFLHIAEGQAADPDSKQEFDTLAKKGLVRPGVVVIHGVALVRSDFDRMARAGVPLVWSPKSNFVLYGETARVEDAIDAGVTVALAPDWTISGSSNLLAELKVADEYSRRSLAGKISPARLFRMVTSDAAKAAGVDERLGRL